MAVPAPNEQIRFLVNVQRLLSEGQFVATYKYALLLALADLAVERGDDSGAPLTVDTAEIAEKFVSYYWCQVVPYSRAGAGAGAVLKQNTGRQATVIRLIAKVRNQHGGSLAAAQRDRGSWPRLVREVGSVVRAMPLWKLQVAGDGVLEFLYENRRRGEAITLLPGVAYCLRQFHGLINELVRGAWVRFVRQQNLPVLGDVMDLSQFLFGSERTDLSPMRGVLRDVQAGRCFYCQGFLRDSADVDHFVPWVLYPVDLGHNFVLAHRRCNSAKSDRLASEEHLSNWVRRNLEHGLNLGREFDRLGLLHNLPSSFRITHWAYEHTQKAGGLTWRAADILVPLSSKWESTLTRAETEIAAGSPPNGSGT